MDELEKLKTQVAALETKVGIIGGEFGSLNVVFVVISAYFVFIMQNGFAMLESGSVRTKNTKNVLMKNVLDACVGTLAYYLTGFAFAFGEPANEFCGYGNFALAGLSSDKYHIFFFQWTFAATAATIVSGSVAERTSFYAYLSYTAFLSSFVYPVVSHWMWSEKGWLSPMLADPLFGVGSIDFAGVSVVHMVGGWSGLMGAVCVGARAGRFNVDGSINAIPGHSATLMTLGILLLWTGWYGFNVGSTGAAVNLSGDGAQPVLTLQRVAVNTTIAASTAGLTALVIVRFRDNILDLVTCLNGACGSIEPYGAVICGFVGACVYLTASYVLLWNQIDDPLEAFPIHGCVGFWGMIATGLLSTKWAQADAGYRTDNYGLFYGGGGRLLGANLIAALTIAGWTCALVGLFFLTLRKLELLRIPYEEEVRGIDLIKHGGEAYSGPGRETHSRRDVRNLTNNAGEGYMPEMWKAETTVNNPSTPNGANENVGANGTTLLDAPNPRQSDHLVNVEPDSRQSIPSTSSRQSNPTKSN